MGRKHKHKAILTIGGPKGATCEELLAILSDYVDGTAVPCICHELESHLKDCNPCRVVVDTMRKTIQLYRENEPRELPPDFQARLHECLRTNWKKKADKPATPQRDAR